MPCAGRRVAMVLLALACASPARAQGPSGNVSVFADYLPRREHTAEVRVRAFAEDTLDPSPWLRISMSGFAEGLVARRPAGPAASDAETVTDAILQVRDAAVELRLRNVDVLVGYARTVWGRLDELQPTDVINPLDASRFFFEGRGEARLPVMMVRARVSLGDAASVEGIYAPKFRRGRYDQLDEATSPFNLARATGLPCADEPCVALPLDVVREEPSFRAGNAQGGGRFSVTTGRVDWSVAAWRGFEPFGLYERDPGFPAVLLVRERFPRFTMIGGDFETVTGIWGLRGEIAVLTEDSFITPDLRIAGGTSVDAGVGFDRRAGPLTLSGTMLLHVEAPDRKADAAIDRRRDVTLVASADRSFRREQYRLRTFGVYNPNEGTVFLRAIGTTSLRDNLALEGSFGLFAGEGRDLIGRFADNDFGYVRLRYFF